MENENLFPDITKDLANKKAAPAPKNVVAWRNFSKKFLKEERFPKKQNN